MSLISSYIHFVFAQTSTTVVLVLSTVLVWMSLTGVADTKNRAPINSRWNASLNDSDSAKITFRNPFMRQILSHLTVMDCCVGES